MGRVLVIDGPEKAGKTTLCKRLAAELGLQYRHWGPVAHATEYGVALRADLQHDRDWVWDRSWASECVYSKYFSRPSQIADDHWLAEWLYGNAARTWGLRVMLTHFWAPHDDTDLPIPQAYESVAFKVYADYFDWFQPDWRMDYLPSVVRAWNKFSQADGYKPPTWVGPSASPIVVVGEERNDPSLWDPAAKPSPYPGPFSSTYTTRLARALGFLAFDVAWTNMADCPPEFLAGKYVAACGGRAADWAFALNGPFDVARFPHPSWLYRWGAAKHEVRYQEAEFIKYVQAGMG